MILPADELLKTKTIKELRILVETLNNDSLSKQTELQVMVGSKYHDFIQSANEITEMKKRSEIIQLKLSKFDKLCYELINNTNYMLQAKDIMNNSYNNNQNSFETQINIQINTQIQSNTQTNIQTSVQTHVQTQELLLLFNSEKIWYYLNECNIFNASLIIITAKILLNPKNYINNYNINNYKIFLDTLFMHENYLLLINQSKSILFLEKVSLFNPLSIINYPLSTIHLLIFIEI